MKPNLLTSFAALLGAKKVAAANFFINLATLSILYGYGVPQLMRKIVRKDLANSQIKPTNFPKMAPPKLEDFIKNATVS